MLLYYEKDMHKLPLDTPPKVSAKISEVLKTLDDNYGTTSADRNNYGGCVLYAPIGTEYISKLAEFHIDMETTVSEFTEVVTTDHGKYFYILFQISSDFGIGLIVHVDDMPDTFTHHFS